jgi:monoamine oxidase
LSTEKGWFNCDCLRGKLYSEAEIANQLRPFAEQIAQDAALVEEDFDKYAFKLDQLSVTEYIDKHTSKISAPFIRTLIENSIRTEYGVEPNESSALQLLFNFPVVTGDNVDLLGDSDEAFFIAGGTGKLIESLSSALSGQI